MFLKLTSNITKGRETAEESKCYYLLLDRNKRHVLAEKMKKKETNFRYEHCVKSVQIRRYFWFMFSYIRTEYRKIRTRNNVVFGHFSRSGGIQFRLANDSKWLKNF